MATVLIENQTDIERTLLENLIKEAQLLPSGKIALVLYNQPHNTGKLGFCIPKSLLTYASDYRYFFIPFVNKYWDCGIVILPKVCSRSTKYPAYFSFIFGHELGHALICLSDMSIHIRSCLIHKFIGDASEGNISKRHELPDERFCDQYGIKVAEKLFSRKQLESEINQLLKIPEMEARDQLEALFSSTGPNTLDNLKKELISFSSPYKENLIKLWKKDCEKESGKRLTGLIRDYEALFI